MNHETTESLRQAACIALPLEVIDKYFGASPKLDPFEHQTARAICRRCIGRIACLTDAVGSPAVFGGSEDLVRGGESGASIRELRRKHFLGGLPVAELVDRAIEQQGTARDVGGFDYLRRGRFPDAVLATDWNAGDD